MIEEWKPIPEHEELYEVNIKGQVRSLPHRVLSRWGKTRIQRGMILKPYLDPTGYLVVRLYKNGKSKKFSIHRLIALNFLEKTGECVNHKDSNRQNNSIDNLEWCTQQENIQHAQDKGRLYFKYGEQHPNKRLTSRQVMEIQREGFEYELTVNFNIERDNHLATASKDRTGLFINADPFVVTESTGKQLRDWADKGAVPAITPQTPATPEQKDSLREYMKKGLLDAAFADRIDQATYLKTEELLKRLDAQAAQQQAEFAAHAEAQAKKAEEAAKEEAPKSKGKTVKTEVAG